MTTTDKFYNAELPEHVPPALVHDFNIFNAGSATGGDHFKGYRRLHEQGVPDIFWTRNNGGHWVVARGEFIPQIAADPGTFSSTRMSVPDQHNITGFRLVPIMIDPPDHAKYRNLIQPFFMPRAIAAMHDSIRAMAIDLIEGFYAKGECDFIEDFALQMPIGIFLRLVDLPDTHRLDLLQLVYRMIHPSEEKKDDVISMFRNFLSPIIAERRANKGSDLFSTLIHSKVDGRDLTDEELEGMCTLLLLGGLDTVANTMGFVAHFLADNPGHRQDLIDNPDIIPNAVEELLRRLPTVSGPGRYVIKDTTFNGVTMKKGDHILMPRAMYNFDHRLFENPMDVDFRRPRPIHASFGTAGGPHRCPGSFLARNELAIFLEEWLKRIPNYQVKPGATIKYDGGFNVSLRSLPLVWDVK